MARLAMASKAAKRQLPKLSLVFRDNPNRVDYAGDEAEDSQQDVDPEVLANPHL